MPRSRWDQGDGRNVVVRSPDLHFDSPTTDGADFVYREPTTMMWVRSIVALAVPLFFTFLLHLLWNEIARTGWNLGTITAAILLGVFTAVALWGFARKVKPHVALWPTRYELHVHTISRAVELWKVCWLFPPQVTEYGLEALEKVQLWPQMCYGDNHQESGLVWIVALRVLDPDVAETGQRHFYLDADRAPERVAPTGENIAGILGIPFQRYTWEQVRSPGDTGNRKPQ